MIAEEGKGEAAPVKVEGRQIPWGRILVGILLGALGLWYVTRDAGVSEIRTALAEANPLYILLGLLVIVVTMLAKAWRWQHLYHPRAEAPPFPELFWALSLGQLVNAAVPFVRLGELARVYDLGQHTNSSKARALGTLVVEKVLDMLLLALTLFLLLPLLVIPTFVTDSGLVLALMAALAFFLLFLVAYQTDLVLRLARSVLRYFPGPLRRRLSPVMVSGLEGLSALRNPLATLRLLADSGLIVLLSILTPLVLFPALNLPLNAAAAATIHVGLTVGTLPPSTPAKVGIFEFLVVFLLTRFFAVEEDAIALAYALVFHLVVVLPQLLLGGIALARDRGRGRSERPA